MSGIGGQMIEAERILVEREPPQEANTTDTANGGAAMMRQAADEVLKDRFMDIALALAKSSEEGHIQCSKFLYDLADKSKPLGEVEIARQFHSLADELAAEPQWRWDEDENTANSAGESLKPEC